LTPVKVTFTIVEANRWQGHFWRIVEVLKFQIKKPLLIVNLDSERKKNSINFKINVCDSLFTSLRLLIWLNTEWNIKNLLRENETRMTIFSGYWVSFDWIFSVRLKYFCFQTFVDILTLIFWCHDILAKWHSA
jgi:hypothetical protein